MTFLLHSMTASVAALLLLGFAVLLVFMRDKLPGALKAALYVSCAILTLYLAFLAFVSLAFGSNKPPRAPVPANGMALHAIWHTTLP